MAWQEGAYTRVHTLHLELVIQEAAWVTEVPRQLPRHGSVKHSLGTFPLFSKSGENIFENSPNFRNAFGTRTHVGKLEKLLELRHGNLAQNGRVRD
jgi:hypothetical protein